MSRPLAICCVAYRTPDLLRTCLAGLATHLPDVPVHVHDNSAEHAAELDDVVRDHPDVTWHRGGRNIGFAAAVNALAASVPGHDLLLVNPDALLQGPLTATLAAIRGPGVAAAAPLTPPSSGAGRPWDVAHRPRGVVRALVSAAGYAEQLRRTPLSELYADRPDDVDGYLTGACLAISREAWDAVGAFDEEYFLYGEESQWQQRARAAGWRLVLADEPGVLHESAGTVASDPAASTRSGDLLRTNIALQIDQSGGTGSRRGDLYLAGTSVLDRVQRSKRRTRARRGATDRPSVVLTINRLVYGGAERHHVVLATELARRGHDVTIVALQRFGPLVAEVPHSVRVVRQPWWAPATDLPPGPSVVVTGDTNTETGFGTLWRARPGADDRRWLVGAHVPPDPDGPTYSAGLARAMRRADGFVALSPRHREQVEAHHDVARRRFVAPNGVAHAAGLADVPPRPERDPGAPLRLVMMSRIVELKNPHLLVEALDGLRDRAWTLDVFGDGPDRARLEALTPDDLRDRVRWRGWSPGPDHAFADADVVCLPSRSEAFPLTILEAMARRLPVVASATCAVPDMLDHGRAGVVVDDVTVQGWRTALAAVLDDPTGLSALADRGLARTRDHYTIEAMADAYENAITEVLS
ncbi:glycosyltransferase [Aeromicrobium sp. Root472D3]|uniref:glycosyltransferase n=2 Tax=Aeromicrobium TaxID=2040 RepID=UPI000700822D|nr:glycosyltransferase [Aeromicrobium sp. Root472D3]KQX74985.1 glycosyl transferase family 1 [Aeromicrobium sp. Root472D3]